MNYHETDPEFMEIFEHFAFDEVVNEEGQQLDDVTRHMAIMATLLGCQGEQEFRLELPRALDAGVTPVMAKEIIYQAVDYLGIGRVLPFLNAANEILTERGVKLPLEGQATTTKEDRLEKGIDAQAEIFGDHMREAWKAGHINRWLADNCFGDYYTRTGLDLAQREMITFCFLAAQGGCEPQLTAHAQGNMNLGNDEAFLMKVVSQCLPYIGYPRSLNAVTCIQNAAKARK
ncbi:MAG TPA: carboxymuconolactone decarboxylase family protein [Candidatus Anaerostipes excrementavium]|uniref:Carboxymuconolactone decarboxylase family protein n=1 Tax=Candidatus Anaerostipes excrementavium TaxID=2838463 RepID=A0A9D1WWT3_9FIRM|nr:carboxymuconolactone decarboxylase family protein [uncultured Anaerostipes sp.]HIX68693.1 carboxymuconolactone decarboxylase family protein [Candidatus Anaerostipes excrementavium]